MKFTKMQGIGNDYVYVDCFKEQVTDPVGSAVRVSDRHFGIGSDGLILIKPTADADCEMEMYNADGSKGEMCGNGVRCVAKYVYDRGICKKEEIRVLTGAGIKTIKVKEEGGEAKLLTVDMGEPILSPKAIPCTFPGDRMINEAITADGVEYKGTAVSMGNPHLVIFLNEDITNLDLEKIGPFFEGHSRFPARVNTEFVNIIDRSHLSMRVWERGSGETLACGTGACAVAVAAALNGFAERKVEVKLLGGSLFIEYGEDGHVYMTGPAAFVFDGECDYLV